MKVQLSDQEIEILSVDFVNETVDWKRVDGPGSKGACQSRIPGIFMEGLEAQIKQKLEKVVHGEEDPDHEMLIE